MNLKILTGLAAIAIAAAAVLLWPEKPAPENQALFPEFNLEKLNQINQITILSGAEKINLTHNETLGWTIPEFDDYPADTIKIRKLLTTFLEVKKLEKKTSDPAYYSRLGVDNPENPDTDNALVALKADDSEYSLILGNPSKQLSQGQYVRKLGDEDSWLVNRRFAVDTTASEWLDTQILHFTDYEISQIKVHDQSSKKSFELERTEADKPLTLKMDEQNQKELSENDTKYKIKQLLTVVYHMKFKALWPDETDKEETTVPTEPIVAEYITADKTILTITAYKYLEKELFKIAATAAEDATSIGQEKAQQIMALTENRIFEMPNISYNALVNSSKEIINLLKEDKEQK